VECHVLILVLINIKYGGVYCTLIISLTNAHGVVQLPRQQGAVWAPPHKDEAGGRRKQFHPILYSLFYSAFLNVLEMYILYTILAALVSFFILKWLKKRRHCTDLKRLDGKTVLITGNVKQQQQQQQHKRHRHASQTPRHIHSCLSFL